MRSHFARSLRRHHIRAILATAAIVSPEVAQAGPPFLTDDPEPTEAGHWEIYAPAVERAGRARDYEGDAGVELNYGAAPGVQVTLGLPAHYVHDDLGMTSGAGDLRFSVKLRLFHDDARQRSIAIFPGITLPTAGRSLRSPNVTALLPVWLQQNWGTWSVFGGGGYAINPGTGNRDFWTGGVALSRALSERLLFGIETHRQGADTIDGRAEMSFGIGAVVRLSPHLRLLASAGPTWIEGGAPTQFHAFFALGLDY